MFGGNIAVWIGSYGCDFKAALRCASDDAYRQVYVDVLDGPLRPAALTLSGRRHLLRHVRGLGLQICGLGAEYAGRGLCDSTSVEQRLSGLRETFDLAADLGVARVTTRLSGLADPSAARLAAEVLAQAAELADRRGVHLAVCAPADDLEPLAARVVGVNCAALTLGLDAAEMLDATGLPGDAAGRIGSFYARDVRRSGSASEPVEFGRGDVDFPGLLAMLEQNGYVGPLVARCDPAQGGRRVVRQARPYLERLIGTDRT